jgi:hypothetical protein
MNNKTKLRVQIKGLLWIKETHPDFFSEDLKNITSDDNHVIAFYKIEKTS